MTYSEKYQHLTVQRAYSRRVAAGGVAVLLEPYRVRRVAPVPVQRRGGSLAERLAAAGRAS